jgi:hypothetical protein
MQKALCPLRISASATPRQMSALVSGLCSRAKRIGAA